MSSPLSYAKAGVNYDAIDPFKRAAQEAARGTAKNLARFSFTNVGWSRGESCYLVETPWGYIAHVEEGLGTKNLVADAMYRLTGKSYYDQIAQDTVAMIVNDMVTLGALPLSVAMHLAIGESAWLEDGQRSRDLVDGWKAACDLAQCTWGPGETPTLKDVVMPGAAVLSGSAVGIVQPKERLINPAKIQEGDCIILVASSGIHANGLTLARKIAEKLPNGYLTKLPDGRAYGETLLKPTHIYVPLIERCLNEGIEIHSAVPITGHGLRKLMRAPQPFAYVVERLPELSPIFDFLQKHGPVDDYEAYGNFNMGVGLALYVPSQDADSSIRIAYWTGFNAFNGGYIEKSGEKKVIVRPKGLEYKANTLAVR